VDARPFHGGSRLGGKEDSDNTGVRGHKQPKGNPKIVLGGHKGRSAEPRREPETVWESMEQLEEGDRREMLVRCILHRTRPEERVISPVPPVDGPRRSVI
jgi:hypothetical protein